MQKIYTLVLPAVLFAAVLLGMLLFPEPLEQLAQQAKHSGVAGQAAFVALLVIATVFAPVTVMPMIPMAAMTFGPFQTAILSVVGWTLGAVIAFLLARHLGRPLLQHLVSLEKLDAFVEVMPSRTRFMAIVILRLTIPVDIASYALGLSKHIGLLEYTAATFVGVLWFSFAFAYLGDAALQGNMAVFLKLGLASLLIFAVGWYMLRRLR